MTRLNLSAPRLLWRHVTAGAGASITVAVVVFVLAGISVGAPRAVQQLVTESVQHEVATLPVTARDLVGQAFGGPVVGPSSAPEESPHPPEVDAVWGAFEDGLASIRAEMPDAVERSVGAVQYAVTLQPNKARADWPGAPDSEISLGFDPRILQHVTMITGEAPTAATRQVPSAEPTEIMLSEGNAARMEWAVGELRELRTPDGNQPLLLSGIFQANDQDDPYWQHIAASLRPSIEIIGLAPPVYIGVGFAHAASWSQVVPFSAGAQMRSWFPVEPESLTAENASAFAGAVREFTRSEHPVAEVDSEEEWFGRFTLRPVTEMPFSTRVTNALDDAIAGTSAASAVLAMMASGPTGVAGAVLLLGSRLIAGRRSTGLQLAAARGASPGQLRTSLALEGLAVGLPAAILGAVAVALVVPGALDQTTIALVVIVGVLPAALVAMTPGVSTVRRERHDLAHRVADSWRWIVELLVLGAAALSVLLLFRRGLSATSGAVTVDPLLAAVPLLLALATSVMVMRLYPIPLGWVARATRGRRGLVAFLGAARGIRDPSAGLVPVLAMVVGISVAVFSAAMLSTVDNGVERSATAAVGADLLVSSQAITAAQADAIAETPGVAATAPVYAEVRLSLTYDGERDYLTVIVVDADELAAVQQGRAGSIQGLERLRSAGEPVPVIASDAVVEILDGASDAQLDRTAIDVVGTAPSDGPISNRRTWVVVDRANAERLVGTIYSPSRVFVDLEEGASAAEVSEDIRSIVQESATVSTPEDVDAQFRSNPVVSGLQSALIAALLLVSFLCTIAVVMTLARGAPARDRLLAMLRTLGLGRRSGTAVVAWELLPMAIVALIAGTALGLALPAVVLAGVDFTLFTGGAEQPPVTIDPFLTALVTGGFLLLVAFATAVTVMTARRIDPASALRSIEE